MRKLAASIGRSRALKVSAGGGLHLPTSQQGFSRSKSPQSRPCIKQSFLRSLILDTESIPLLSEAVAKSFTCQRHNVSQSVVCKCCSYSCNVSRNTFILSAIVQYLHKVGLSPIFKRKVIIKPVIIRQRFVLAVQNVFKRSINGKNSIVRTIARN